MKPQRIQRKRIKGWKMPENTVSVTRPGKWGNPYKVGVDGTAQYCVDVFMIYAHIGSKYREEAKKELKGKNLACFCKIGDPCHGDVLLKIANQEE